MRFLSCLLLISQQNILNKSCRGLFFKDFIICDFFGGLQIFFAGQWIFKNCNLKMNFLKL